MATQKEAYSIKAWQNDAYYNYALLCIKLDETPKEEVISLIKGCTDIKQLLETVNIFKSKLELL